MEFYQPLDYSAGFKESAALFPDYADQAIRRRTVAVQEGLLRQQQEATQRELADQQSFETDFQALGRNPTLQGMAAVVAKHPKMAKPVQDYYSAMDSQRRTDEQTRLGSIFEAGRTNHWDLAEQLLGQHADAEAKAGLQPDPTLQTVLEAIKSRDPAKLNEALGVIGYLTAAANPSKFNETYKTLMGGSDVTSVSPNTVLARYNPVTQKMEEVYRSPYTTGPEGEVTGPEDGGTAPAAAPADPLAPLPEGAPPPAQAPAAAPAGGGGFDAAFEHVIGNEGTTYVAHDMNGKPVKFGINQGANPDVDVKNLTKDQAKQIYKDRYWNPSGAATLPANMQAPYFDVYIRNPKMAQAALRQSGGDPTKFMQIAGQYFQNLGATTSGQPYAKSWANRDRKNLAIASGQAPAGAAPAGETPAAPAAAPEGVITAPAGRRFLSPRKGYTLSADGKQQIPIEDKDFGPEEIKFWAEKNAQTDEMPSLGGGNAAGAIKRKILAESARIQGAAGLTGSDLAVQKAWYRAKLKAVTTLENQYGTVQANEQTARDNGKLFLDASSKLSTGNSRYRLLNAAQQSYLRHTGDPGIAAMDAAAMTFANEYARVMTGTPTGGGNLTDSARAEAAKILQGDFSWQQKLSTYRMMLADMNNRLGGFQKTIAQTYRDLGSRAPSLREKGLPAGAKYLGTINGKRVIELNGKRQVEE